MRLIVTTPFLETRGGAERVVLKIAKHFDATIRCLSYNSKNTFSEFQNINVETAPQNFLDKLPSGNRFTTVAKAWQHFYNLKLDGYDVINANQTPSEWIRNKNSPVLWYCHSPHREAFDLYKWRMKKQNLLAKPFFWVSVQAFKFFELGTVSKIEHIFTNSKNTQKRVKKYLRRNSEVLYPGVDSWKFTCKDYEKFFFYPSRIAPEKDFEFAIEAFKIFSARFKGWKFVIAGYLSERPAHQKYFKKLRAMCNDSIIIETNISEERMLDLYSRCYAVLYTPIDEDFGLVPLEAMASSKPCIAKSEGGPMEAINDGKDGFLVSSIWEMAGKMEWLAKHSERCEDIGRVGRMKVGREFTWARFLKRFEQKARELAK